MHDTRILHTYMKRSSRRNVKNDTTSGQNSRHNITMVLSTVATWSMTSNCRLWAPLRSRPRNSLKISRCPDELIGRYSANPCTIPKISASIISISYFFFPNGRRFGSMMIAAPMATKPRKAIAGPTTMRRVLKISALNSSVPEPLPSMSTKPSTIIAPAIAIAMKLPRSSGMPVLDFSNCSAVLFICFVAIIFFTLKTFRRMTLSDSGLKLREQSVLLLPTL